MNPKTHIIEMGLILMFPRRLHYLMMIFGYLLVVLVSLIFLFIQDMVIIIMMVRNGIIQIILKILRLIGM